MHVTKFHNDSPFWGLADAGELLPHLRGLPLPVCTPPSLSDTMHLLISVGKSTPPQNHQLSSLHPSQAKVERTQHIQESQGQILALAFRSKSLTPRLGIKYRRFLFQCAPLPLDLTQCFYRLVLESQLPHKTSR